MKFLEPILIKVELPKGYSYHFLRNLTTKSSLPFESAVINYTERIGDGQAAILEVTSIYLWMPAKVEPYLTINNHGTEFASKYKLTDPEMLSKVSEAVLDIITSWTLRNECN